MKSITRNILTGVLTIIPLWVTVWVTWLVVDILVGASYPVVRSLARANWLASPEVSQILLADWFQSAVALLLTLTFLYLLGWFTHAVVGRRMVAFFNQLIGSVPLASTIYRATHTLVQSLRGDEIRSGQHIVMIEFPMPGRRAVGIVTRIFPANAERPDDLAAVYVPTTPNPTSGFVLIIPTSELLWLNWTKNEAMAFIVSGGSMSPENVSIEPAMPTKP